MEMRTISFDINDRHINITVPVHRTLLEMIREDIGLTGTKEAVSYTHLGDFKGDGAVFHGRGTSQRSDVCTCGRDFG